jgi:hypothetical protein
MDGVWIGRTEYMRFEFDNDPGSPWLKGPTLPKDSFGPLGALQEVGPLGELSLDEGVSGLRIQDAGPGIVHGVETVQYRIVVPTCAASTSRDGFSESMGPLQLWVDGQGRLVQARQSTTEDIAKNARLGELAGEPFPTGRVTSVDLVDLGDFGAPAAIAAPRVLRTNGSSSSGFATFTPGPCH